MIHLTIFQPNRWAKEYLRRRLDWMVEDLYGRQDYSSNNNPRHIRTALCPCQVRFTSWCETKLGLFY